jgi:hypothetical protein
MFNNACEQLTPMRLMEGKKAKKHGPITNAPGFRPILGASLEWEEGLEVPDWRAVCGNLNTLQLDSQREANSENFLTSGLQAECSKPIQNFELVQAEFERNRKVPDSMKTYTHVMRAITCTFENYLRRSDNAVLHTVRSAMLVDVKKK